MAKQFKPETLCVQAGWTPKKGEPRVLPIYQSTTFKYDTSEQMARLFDLEDIRMPAKKKFLQLSNRIQKLYSVKRFPTLLLKYWILRNLHASHTVTGFP